MIMNNTTSTLLHHHHHSIESIDEPTAIAELAPIHYDSSGAALFIIVVLLWYSSGIVCMLGMQIRARAETIEDSARRRAKLIIRTLRDQTQTKEILEELVDKQKRDKLWNIYLDKPENNKDKLIHDEFLRIKNIEKLLTGINRNRMIMNDKLISPTINHCIRRRPSDSQSIIIPDISSIEIQPRIRRRSSLDQQIIERWKLLVDQSKIPEQLPWTFRKLMIHRQFRKYHKNISKEFEQINSSIINSSLNHEDSEYIDDEQCHLIPLNEQINNDNKHQITMKTDDRLNPYITYFHLPINENVKSNNPNLSLLTIKSNHHIIQMNHDESQC